MRSLTDDHQKGVFPSNGVSLSTQTTSSSRWPTQNKSMLSWEDCCLTMLCLNMFFPYRSSAYILVSSFFLMVFCVCKCMCLSICTCFLCSFFTSGFSTSFYLSYFLLLLFLAICLYSNKTKKGCGFGLVGKWGTCGRRGKG